MKCRHCSADNVAEAIFCHACGHRLDGMVICPACGEKIDEKSRYCIKCGKKLPSAEEETAVADASVKPAAVKVTQTPVKTRRTFDWKKAVGIAGMVCLGFSVLFSFIFLFCLGATANADGKEIASTLYDYFGKVYEDVDSVGDDTAIAVANTFNITGTVITAVGLCVVLAAVCFTVWRAVKKYAYHEECNWEKPAVIAVLSYILFAAVFMSFHMQQADIKIIASSSYNASLKTFPNQATVAGLALSVLFLVFWLICKIVPTLSADHGKQTFVCGLVGTLKVVLIAVLVILLTLPVRIISIKTVASEVCDVSFGGSWMAMLAAAVGLRSAYNLTGSPDTLAKMQAISAIGVVMTVIAAVLLGLLLYLTFYRSDRKRNVVHGVVALICAVIFAASLAMLALSYNDFREFSGIGELIVGLTDLSYDVKENASCGAPIALLVLSVILAAVCAAECVLARRKQAGESGEVALGSSVVAEELPQESCENNNEI